MGNPGRGACVVGTQEGSMHRGCPGEGGRADVGNQGEGERAIWVPCVESVHGSYPGRGACVPPVRCGSAPLRKA